MTIVDLGEVAEGSSSSAGLTLAVVNNTGATIPAGTLITICYTCDNIASITAPTLSLSTVGGTAPTANHVAALSSGVTTTAGSGIWHQCWRVVTASSIASGATITTITSNQSAVKRTATARGFSGASDTLRGGINSTQNAAGTMTVTTTGTNPAAGDVVVGSISTENNALSTGDSDTTNGSWSAMTGLATTGGGAAANVTSGTQAKVVTAGGAQTFNTTNNGGADTVGCVYALKPVPLTAAVGQATDGGSTAQAITVTRFRNVAVGQATDGGSTAQAIGHTKRKAVAQASETDTAQAFADVYTTFGPIVHHAAAVGTNVVTNTFSVTLPTIPANTGYHAFLVFQAKQSGLTPTTPPAGWTAETPRSAGSLLNARPYTKALTTADSGATATMVWNGGTEGVAILVVVRRTPGIDGIAFANTVTADAALDLPSYTPVADDLTLVAVAAISYVNTPGDSVTAPSGWSELVDSHITSGSAPDNGAWVARRNALPGGAGVPQSLGSATYSAATGREVVWVLGFAPIRVNRATETDTAQPIGHTKRTAIGQATDAGTSGTTPLSGELVEDFGVIASWAAGGWTVTTSSGGTATVSGGKGLLNNAGGGSDSVRVRGPQLASATEGEAVFLARRSATSTHRSTFGLGGSGTHQAAGVSVLQTSGFSAAVNADLVLNAAFNSTNVSVSFTGGGFTASNVDHWIRLRYRAGNPRPDGLPTWIVQAKVWAVTASEPGTWRTLHATDVSAAGVNNRYPWIATDSLGGAGVEVLSIDQLAYTPVFAGAQPITVRKQRTLGQPSDTATAQAITATTGGHNVNVGQASTAGAAVDAGTDTFTGIDGAAWDARWTTSAVRPGGGTLPTIGILSNKGRIAALAGAAASNVQAVFGTALDAQYPEALFSFTADAAQSLAVWLLADSFPTTTTFLPTNGVGFTLGGTGGVTPRWSIAGSSGNLSASTPTAMTLGTQYKVRARARIGADGGAVLYVKTWDAASAEPDAWGRVARLTPSFAGATMGTKLALAIQTTATVNFDVDDLQLIGSGARPVNPVKGAVLGQASSTGLAQAVTHAKRKAVAQSSETDTAQAVTANVVVGQASSTGTAQAVASSKTRAVGQASDTATAQAVAAAKRKALGQASDAATAGAVTSRKSRTLGQASDASTAGAATSRKSLGIAQSSQPATAQPVTARKSRALGQSTDTATAQTITPTITRRYVAVGQASGTHTAQLVSPRRSYPVGQATEAAATAQPVTTRKSRTLGQASDAATAQPLASAKRAAVGQASGTHTAQAVTARKSRTLVQASELGTAGAVTARKSRTLGQASDTATAGATTTRRAVAVGQATSSNVALRLQAGIARATGTHLAQPVTSAKRKALGQASDSATAGAVGPRKSREIGQASSGEGYLGLTFVQNGVAYIDMTNVTDYTIQSGDYLEYEVWWASPGATNLKIALDLTGGSWNLRDSGAVDQNGLSSHPQTNLPAAYGAWYLRRISLASRVGQVVTHYDLVCEVNGLGTYVGRIRGARITAGSGGPTNKSIWGNGDPNPTLLRDPTTVGSGVLTTDVVQIGEVAQAVTVRKTRTLGQATDAGTAQAISSRKTRAVAQASDSSTAQPVTVRRSRTLGQASSTATAQAVASSKTRAVGQASDTATAQPVGTARSYALLRATETDSALAVAPTRLVAVGRAQDASTAGSATPAKRLEAGIASELDTALSVATAGRRYVDVTQASETDAAGAVEPAKSLAVVAASDASTAGQVRAAHAVPVGLASDASTARALSSAKRATVGTAEETDAAEPLGSAVATAVGRAADTSTAVAVSSRKARAVGQASEADTASAATVRRRYAVALAADTSAALALTAAKRLALSPATETDTAEPVDVSGSRNVAVEQATETDVAGSATALKRHAVATALEADTAHTVAVLRRVAVGQASDAGTAGTVVAVVSGGGHLVTIGQAVGTHEALRLRARRRKVARAETRPTSPQDASTGPRARGRADTRPDGPRATTAPRGGPRARTWAD